MTDVVFVTHTGQVSGAEKVLLDLVDEALGAGHTVRVACPDGPLPQRLPPGCGRIRIPDLGLAGESGVARVVGAARMTARWMGAGRTLARESGPDTHVVVNGLFALPAARFARLGGGVTWLVHDTVTSTKQRAVIRLGRPALRRAVAVSEMTARPLRALGLSVVVAHNGVRWPVPAVAPVERDPAVVGMLALLTPWKGQSVLLDAVARLDGVRVELAGGHFPGDEPYVRALRERAARPDLAGRVEFVGHVDAASALARWDAMISPSVDPEAGPLSVLEAMSFGVPVIGTDHGGTAEFLADGAGVLVPPRDVDALSEAIGRVVADRELRARIGAEARKRVEAHHDSRSTRPAMLRAVLDPSD